MTAPEEQDEPLIDDDAGRLVRPYTVSNGRTRPTAALDMLSMVRSTGSVPSAHLEPDHARALDLSRTPVTVAEVGAQLRLPVAITKIVLSDLIDCGALTSRPPLPPADLTDRAVLEEVLNGLRRRQK